MARFRLRFLLQELDLHGKEIILGRSPDCQVTLDDPLVSRRHARIINYGDQAWICDLGSRNGVRVNGELIQSETLLKHNDRVRLGTQDLVFLVADPERSGRPSRATGIILHCEQCDRPFPGETPICPHCGAHAQVDFEPDTLTGVQLEPEAAWAFQLLAEVIERALASGKRAEAERALSRAAKEIDERVRGQRGVDARSVSALSGFAFRLAQVDASIAWAGWALALHRSSGAMLSTELIDALETAPESFRYAIGAEVREYLSWWREERASRAPEDQHHRCVRLVGLFEPADLITAM